MVLKKRLAKNLRRQVGLKGISLERFAYENDISKAYIYDIANGRANVSLDMLEKIAKSLRKKPQDLIS